jgi:hypothetical protein
MYIVKLISYHQGVGRQPGKELMRSEPFISQQVADDKARMIANILDIELPESDSWQPTDDKQICIAANPGGLHLHVEEV